MRLNDRVIREELRSEAISASIPDDMWANISHALDQDRTKVRSIAQPRRSSPVLQVRQMLAVGAAAGIFWMMVIPSGAYVDRVQQPAPSPAAEVSSTGTPWDILTESHLKEQAPVTKSVSEARIGSEIQIR